MVRSGVLGTAHPISMVFDGSHPSLDHDSEGKNTSNLQMPSAWRDFHHSTAFLHSRVSTLLTRPKSIKRLIRGGAKVINISIFDCLPSHSFSIGQYTSFSTKVFRLGLLQCFGMCVGPISITIVPSINGRTGELVEHARSWVANFAITSHHSKNRHQPLEVRQKQGESVLISGPTSTLPVHDPFPKPSRRTSLMKIS